MTEQALAQAERTDSVTSLGDPSEGTPRKGETAQFITFAIGDEEYGVDIMMVREIKAWTETTPLPNSPAFMRGVINLRGAIVPIYDMRSRFGMGKTDPSKIHVVVVLALKKRTIGILVDAVSDIITVEKSQIQPPPETDQDPQNAFVSGLVTAGERMVMLLEADKLYDHSHEDHINELETTACEGAE